MIKSILNKVKIKNISLKWLKFKINYLDDYNVFLCTIGYTFLEQPETVSPRSEVRNSFGNSIPTPLSMGAFSVGG